MGKKKYTVDLSEDERKLNGEDEAHLIALARGDPPDGRRRWTLRLLADELVAPEETDSRARSRVKIIPVDVTVDRISRLLAPAETIRAYVDRYITTSDRARKISYSPRNRSKTGELLQSKTAGRPKTG